jgi:hypothetical protein
MRFSEDDLRAALKRKDPGEGFTQRVMARVGQAQAKATQPAGKVAALPPWWTRRPVWSVAAAAILLFAFAWGGYEYSEYRHGEDIRIARENRQRLEEAERARDQAIWALEIARAKLNHVLERAQLPAESIPVKANENIRRQRL